MTDRALLPLLLGSAALAGCASTVGPVGYNGIGNPHVAEVAQVTHTLDLATSGSGLAAGEGDRAADWLASIGFGYGDRAYLADGGGNAGAARDQLARSIGRYGLVLSDAAPVTSGLVAPGSVRLVVLRAEATIAGCPAWRGTDTMLGRDARGFGCATAANMAAMIADPNDLLAGKSAPDTGSSSATAVKAINAQTEAAGTSDGGTRVERITAGGGGN